MRKLIAWLLCVMMLIAIGMPVLSAIETDPSETVEETAKTVLPENAIAYSCVYDKENRKIRIDGKVNYEVMVDHNDFFIEVYRIDPNSTFERMIEQPDIEPLVRTQIAMNFQFSIDALTTWHRFSQYALILRSPDGEIIPAADPQYASVKSTYSYASANRTAFKGIHASAVSVEGNMGFGTAVIPIDLNRLLTTVSHGYLYAIDSTYRYFDEDYINELDAKVRTYCASGAEVYLQFLLDDVSMTSLTETKENVSFYMPDVYSEEVLAKVCAFAEFLSERYDSYQNGQISGIILGTQVDRQGQNYWSVDSAEEYAKQYAFYLHAIASAARYYQPALDIVIPFSNVNLYEEGADASLLAHDTIAPTVFLETLLSFLEKNVETAVVFNLMIESDAIPLQISNSLDTPITLLRDEAENKEAEANAENEENEEANNEQSPEQTALSPENLNLVIDYLNRLKARYSYVPNHVMYKWNVPETLSGDALACAYVYSYYYLLQNRKISSFVVNFSSDGQSSSRALLDLKHILEAIDTQKSFQITKYLKRFFDESLWNTLIEPLNEKDLAFRTVYSAKEVSASELSDSDRWSGSFSYFNFESGALGDWFAGTDCANVKSAYGLNGVRAMEATMHQTEGEEAATILCLYEYPENFVYTPYLRLSLSLHSPNNDANALYEVTVTLGDDTGSLSYEYVLNGQKQITLGLDLHSYNAEHMVDYIKISTRMLSKTEGNYSLMLYSAEGLSEQHSTEELSAMIEAERKRIRNESSDSEDKTDSTALIWMVFGILLSVTVCVLVVYMLFRRSLSQRRVYNEDDPEERSESEDSD